MFAVPAPSFGAKALPPLMMPAAGAIDMAWEQHRVSIFDQVSERVRAPFGWPKPGTPRQTTAEPVVTTRQEQLQNFCLLVFRVESVDRLDLTQMRRFRSERVAGWREIEVWP
jgi:hypothetical protein